MRSAEALEQGKLPLIACAVHSAQPFTDADSAGFRRNISAAGKQQTVKSLRANVSVSAVQHADSTADGKTACIQLTLCGLTAPFPIARPR